MPRVSQFAEAVWDADAFFVHRPAVKRQLPKLSLRILDAISGYVAN
jgi:hypothetical protein